MKPNSLIFLAVLLLLLHGGALAAPNSKQDSATVNPPPQATRYLHISTNPTLSDIYVNRSGIDFSTRPDYVSPNFVKIPQNDTTVRITLFQKGYSDTTINVTLSHKDTSSSSYRSAKATTKTSSKHRTRLSHTATGNPSVTNLFLHRQFHLSQA